MVAVRKRHAAETAGEAAAFLDVSQSARGYVWRERLPRDAQNLALAISQQHGLPELLGRVLAARGVALGDVPVFLDPSVKALMPDPASLAGMDRVAERIADAIVRREPVAIFGDYDVDGACSSALMARFLMAHDTPSRIYIPDRIFEGYGPNIAAIETLVKEGAKLIVTVDCGTTSFETDGGGQEARRPTFSSLITIRRTRRFPRWPAVVNPNRQDDVSGQGHLCAAGRRFPCARRCDARAAPAGTTMRNGAMPPDLLARSRSRCAGDGGGRGAAHGAQSRLCAQGSRSYEIARECGAARACSMRRVSIRRRRRITSATFWDRASMRAGASEMRRWARDC